MEALIPISFVAGIVLAWYFFLNIRNKERMALIEKGANASEFFTKRNSTFRFPWLKLGIIITGIGVGAILSLLLLSSPNITIANHVDHEVFSFVSVLLFGGISMIVAAKIDKPFDSK